MLFKHKRPGARHRALAAWFSSALTGYLQTGCDVGSFSSCFWPRHIGRSRLGLLNHEIFKKLPD